VFVAEYVEQMYGDTDSRLHRGLGTDRFVVAWPVSTLEADSLAAQSRRLSEDPSCEVHDAPLLNPDLADGSVPDLGPIERGRPRVLRVAIPRDISAVQAESLDQAGRWRQSTRRAFQWALVRDYTVRGVYAATSSEGSYYVLTNDSSRSQEK
jgi:predicted GNAT superfamily acetyltransferase